jgi:predicted nucleotidyltransferase
MSDSDEAVRVAAIELAKQLCQSAVGRLGNEFLGFYLLGSLAHGGFNRRYSDIDIALISEYGVDDAFLEVIKAESEAIAPDLAHRVSLFWSDCEFSKGRFPPLDRLDYLEHAVALYEVEKVVIPKPDLEEVRTYLRGAPFEQWAERGTVFSTQSALDPDDRKSYLKTHLYPARFAFSWVTGQIASNDAALAYLHDHPLARLDMDLLDRALACRHAADDPDILFDDRISLPAQYQACAQLIG